MERYYLVTTNVDGDSMESTQKIIWHEELIFATKMRKENKSSQIVGVMLGKIIEALLNAVRLQHEVF